MHMQIREQKLFRPQGLQDDGCMDLFLARTVGHLTSLQGG
jgi:hypothetical protein